MRELREQHAWVAQTPDRTDACYIQRLCRRAQTYRNFSPLHRAAPVPVCSHRTFDSPVVQDAARTACFGWRVSKDQSLDREGQNRSLNRDRLPSSKGPFHTAHPFGAQKQRQASTQPSESLALRGTDVTPSIGSAETLLLFLFFGCRHNRYRCAATVGADSVRQFSPARSSCLPRSRRLFAWSRITSRGFQPEPARDKTRGNKNKRGRRGTGGLQHNPEQHVSRGRTECTNRTARVDRKQTWNRGSRRHYLGGRSLWPRHEKQ